MARSRHTHGARRSVSVTESAISPCCIGVALVPGQPEGEPGAGRDGASGVPRERGSTPGSATIGKPHSSTRDPFGEQPRAQAVAVAAGPVDLEPHDALLAVVDAPTGSSCSHDRPQVPCRRWASTSLGEGRERGPDEHRGAVGVGAGSPAGQLADPADEVGAGVRAPQTGRGRRGRPRAARRSTARTGRPTGRPATTPTATTSAERAGVAWTGGRRRRRSAEGRRPAGTAG